MSIYENVTFVSSKNYSFLLCLFHLLQNRFTNTTDNVLTLTGVRYNIFMVFLRYLYTDHLKISFHFAGDLAKLARKFQLPRLETLCKKLVIKSKHNNSAMPNSTFALDLQQAINDPESADLKFIVQDETVLAHRAILTARVPYFERLLQGDFKEKQQVGIFEFTFTNNKNILN